MTLLRSAGLGALGLLLVACTLPLKGQEEVGLPANTCSVEGEVGGACGPEGECLRSLCRPTLAPDVPVVFLVSRVQLSGNALLQPIPVFSIPSLEQLRVLSRQNSIVERPLPAAASLDLSLLGPDPKKSVSTSARGCFFNEQAPNRTLPFHATFRPSSSLRGLPLDTFAENAADPNKISPPLNLKANFLLPPATYDLYVVPSVDSACPIPPILRTEAPLSEQINILTIELPSTSKISGTVTADPSLDLSSWSVQIVEARTGLRVSTISGFVQAGAGSWSLGTPYEDGLAPLEFYRPSGPSGEPVGELFFVMSPPPGLLAPRLAWGLSVVDFFGDGQIALDLGDFALSSVTVDLRSELTEEARGQRAWVWLDSALVPGALLRSPEGAFASLSLGPLQSGDAGDLSLQLPPGRYDVRAVASSVASLDIARQTFNFFPDEQDPAAPLAGFSLPFSSPQSLEIPILSALDNTTFARVPFELNGASSPALLTSLFGLHTPSPRGGTGLTDLGGWLRVSPDSGTYDLTIRIPTESGFPWLSKPGVVFPPEEPGALRVSLPVEIKGRLVDPVLSDPSRRPLVGAWLRAYALVGDHYVYLAETTLEPNGSYRLLLPSGF